MDRYPIHDTNKRFRQRRIYRNCQHPCSGSSLHISGNNDRRGPDRDRPDMVGRGSAYVWSATCHGRSILHPNTRRHRDCAGAAFDAVVPGHGAYDPSGVSVHTSGCDSQRYQRRSPCLGLCRWLTATRPTRGCRGRRAGRWKHRGDGYPANASARRYNTPYQSYCR